MLRVLTASAFALLGSAGASLAGDVVIALPDAVEVERSTIAYDCGSSSLSVDYINAGGNALAVLHLDEGPLIAANVISASGARYAGGIYIWWTKGDAGDLYDETKGDAPIASCRAKD